MNAESSYHPGLLHRTGHWCAAHAWLVAAVWLVLLVGIGIANHRWGGTYADNFSLPGTSAQTGADLLKQHRSTSSAGTASQIVIESEQGPVTSHQDAIDSAVGNLGELPDVLSVSNPLTTPGAIAPNGQIARIGVEFSSNPATFGRSYLDQVDTAVAPMRAQHVTVEYADPLGQLAQPKAADRTSEAIGLGVAVLVLLIGFGSIAAAGLPLITAVLGLAVGLSGLGLLAAHFSFAQASPTLAAMMGLGVGIDYALFLSTRYRALLQGGAEPREAVGRTVTTSGRAVLVAACTVAMALAGLYASGISFIGTLGVAAGITVVVAAGASLTLTPALLGLLGHRIDRLHVRTPVAEPGESDFWLRWAARIGLRPWLYLVGGLLVLGVLAVPAASMRLGHVDAGAQPTSSTDRRAYDLTTEGFGAGANAAITVVTELDSQQVDSQTQRQDLASTLQHDLAAVPGVAAVAAPVASPDNVLLITTVTPTTGPQDRATTNLIHTLENTIVPGALAGTGATGYVTGITVSAQTFTDTLAAKLPLIIGAVVGAAFLLLLTVFRSLLVALKAAVLNLCSIAAAWGVVVAVFQWGWGGSVLGIGEKVPVESYVPMMMFAIVFGLSMDYEVFLLSRIRESWLQRKDNHLAVATGLAATALVITCAALIMTSVFLAFLLSPNVVVKMLALGLGVSVIIDATIVRLILVPATMYLLGRANWWLPRWLDRLLPRLDPDGAAQGELDDTEMTAGPETKAVA